MSKQKNHLDVDFVGGTGRSLTKQEEARISGIFLKLKAGVPIDQALKGISGRKKNSKSKS